MAEGEIIYQEEDNDDVNMAGGTPNDEINDSQQQSIQSEALSPEQTPLDEIDDSQRTLSGSVDPAFQRPQPEDNPVNMSLATIASGGLEELEAESTATGEGELTTGGTPTASDGDVDHNYGDISMFLSTFICISTNNLT